MLSLYKHCSSSEVAHWENRRTLGKNAFIWNFGIKNWATFMFIALMLISYYTAPDKSIFGFWYTLETLAFNAVLAGFGGYLYGYLVWLGTEKSYKRWKST